MARLWAWAAIALLTLYLVFVGGGWQGIYNTYIRSASVALSAIVVGGWLLVAWQRPQWRPRSVLLPAIIACLGSLAISTAASRFPRLSVEYLGYAIILAALYLLLVRILADEWFRARMATLVTALATVIGVLFLALVVGRWLTWWGLVGYITVPPLRPNFESLVYGNPSAVMTMSLLLTIAAIAWTRTKQRGSQAISGALVALSAVVIILSGSRAGWVAVVATIVVVVGLAGARSSTRDRARGIAVDLFSRPRSRYGLAAFGLIAVAAVVALGPALFRRLISGGEDLRLTYLAIAGRIFAEAPLVGTGPGTWVIQRTALTRPPELDFYIPHAHNLPMQTLAELGLVGAAAGGFLVLSLVLLVRDAFRNTDPVRQRWAWAALISLVYFAFHQLLDLYVNMAAVLFAASLPVAWLDATSDRPLLVWRRHLPSRFATAPAAAACVLFAVSAAGLWLTETPARQHAEAVALANDGHWAAAAEPARAAAASDPAWPPYQLTRGLAEMRAGNPGEAAAAFRAVLDIDDLPEAWLGLASAEHKLGNDDLARDAVRASLRLGYQRAAVAMAAGDLAFTLGDRETAIDAYAMAIALIPSLAADPYWDTLGDGELKAVVLERAVTTATSSARWEIRLMANEPSGALELASDLDPDSAAAATEIISAWTGDRNAVEKVLAACGSRPLDVAAVQWCARLQGHVGNAVERERYRAWAEAITGGASEFGAETRVSTTALVGRSIQGDVASFWGTYTYRRPTPWDVLAPDLVHLTLK